MFRTSTWKKVAFIEGRKKYSIHNSAVLPVAIGNTRVSCFTAAKVIARALSKQQSLMDYILLAFHSIL